MAAAFGGTGRVSSFHARAEAEEIVGAPELGGSSGAILLSDPYSFPADAALGLFARQAPTVPVLGGIASARSGERR